MMTNEARQMMKRRVAAVSVAALLAGGCGVEKQVAPSVSGVSEFAQSVVLTATPDQIVQDGASQTRIEAIARDPEGRPISGLALQWSVLASDSSFVEPAAQVTVTDANGRSFNTVTAPPAPPVRPATPTTLTVTATPIGTDFNNSAARIVVVRLVPPTGTLPANQIPVANFTIVPVVGEIGEGVVFDASMTTDEGMPCGDRCTYRWDFGDFGHDTGKMVGHTYSVPGTYSVTLTVTDERGGVGSVSKSIVVRGPSAPVAAFSVTRATNLAGVTITFNAVASSVGQGATINKYVWNFGDGSDSVDAGTNPIFIRSGGYSTPGTYLATLTVTDNFGRTATTNQTITVQ